MSQDCLLALCFMVSLKNGGEGKVVFIKRAIAKNLSYVI